MAKYRLDFAQTLNVDGEWEKSNRLMERYWNSAPFPTTLVDHTKRVNDTNGLGERESYIIQILGDTRLIWVKI